MERRKIGSLAVSVIGLGGNNFGTDFFGKRCDDQQTARTVLAALDAGINFIDTAEEYSVVSEAGSGHSEDHIGTALGSRRDEAVIATKFLSRRDEHPEQQGRERIINAVEGSLRRLRTDYIDLLQQHRPDSGMPMDVVLPALDDLVRAGKVREIGCSNFNADQLDEAVRFSRDNGLATFVSSQNAYNVLEQREAAGVIDACKRHEVKFIPFFPLASGLLTGKYRRGTAASSDTRFGGDGRFSTILAERHLSGASFEKVAALEQFARERGHTLLELAFSWLVSQEVVGSVIAGATTPEQAVANSAAASWKLTPEDAATVAEIVGENNRLANEHAPGTPRVQP